MTRSNNRFGKYTAAFFLCIAGMVYNATAGNFTDSTKKKTQLAALNKKTKVEYTTIPSNVLFPESLNGNEEETLEYIEKFAANRRAYIIRTYNRGQKFFPKVTGIFQKYNLPAELKVLIALESAFNGNAISKAGAVGYWQIMDEVAREYGLKYATKGKAAEKKVITKKGKKVTKTIPLRDDRKNFNKSTYAAARYLKDRSRNLDNDLLLMVASYNCGVGNVWDAMARTGKPNPDFWDVKPYLPAETRAYVMNFITLNVIFHNYEKFINNSLNFLPVKVKLEEASQSLAEAEAKNTRRTL